MNRAAALVLLFSLLSPKSLGQTPQFQYEALTVEHGLSQSSVWSIYQDSYGFMWFGTADGLNKYDGYTFQIYRHDSQDSTSLGSNAVWSILEDRDGIMWIGTIAGLEQFDRWKGTFHKLANEDRYKNSCLNAHITSIIQDQEGKLWIGSFAGITMLDPVSGSIREFGISEFDSATSSAYMKVLCEDEDGSVWVGCSGSPYKFDKGRQKFAYVPLPSDVRTGAPLTCMRLDSMGNTWFGSARGLVKWDREEDAWKTYSHDPRNPRSIGESNVRSLVEDSEGKLWVGTSSQGVNVFDPGTGSFTRFAPPKNSISNARYEGVSSLYRDRSGLIWVGFDGAGLLKLNPRQNKFQHILLPQARVKTTGDNFLKSILVDHLGIVWLGTYDQGIATLNRRTGAVHRFAHRPPQTTSYPRNSVFALLEDRQGGIWTGTSSGLERYDRSTDTFRYFELPNVSPNDARGKIVTHLHEDSSGMLWIGTASQLAKLDPTRTKMTSVLPLVREKGSSLPTHVQCVLPINPGNVWVGILGGGLINMDASGRINREFRHDPSNPNSISSDLVKTICTGTNAVLWVGTELGLNRFDPKTEKWKAYHTLDGLPNDFIYGILMDDHDLPDGQAGNLWISTNRGLSRMDTRDPEHPRFKNYTPDDGLQSYEFNTGVYFKSPDGEMLFGGVNGFNAFYPDSVKDNPVSPRMAFTGFKKFDQPFSLGCEMETVNEIILDYTETVFSIEFAALEFTNPHRNQYAYIMEGVDKDWVYSGTRREARYTHLDPGKYVFRVKGSNNDGVWNAEGTSITVIVTPPWWQTWWAYTGYILAFVGLGFGVRWLEMNWRIIVASRKARYVSHYRLHEELGRGGMGTVYKATDINTKHVVALKLLHPDLLKDPENRKRLMAEGQLLSSFNHPNILRVYEVGETEERGFIAMEYLTGGTLREHLQKSFPLPFDEIKRFALEVACGLKEIHAHGVIHRDMKTGNVMLDDQRNVRIMDFGLSKSPLVTTMTTLGSVIGTLGYVAPEQVTNMNIDQRVDIFSFGVILYELLTNQLPFRGENEIAVIHSIFNTVPSSPSSLQPGVPKWMDEVVMRCLAKEPTQRFASVVEVVTALENFHHGT